MDHVCYKCGATVEEGAPFCPQCRAPQIRVNIPTPEERAQEAADAPATPPFLPGTPGDIQPPAQPVPLTTHIRLRDTIGTALAASIVMIISWVLVPAGLVFATTAAGALAVLLYARRRPEIRLSARNGARIGMMSGAASFFFFLFVVLFGYLADRGATFRQMMEQWITTRAANNPAKDEMLRRLGSPDFMATVVVLMLIFMAIILIGFSSLGGAIAAKLLRRKNPR